MARRCDICSEKYRHYHASGDPRPLPSVTTILDCIAKPALVGWSFREARKATLGVARELYNEYAASGADAASFAAAVDAKAPKSQYNLPKTAADIGTLVHKRIESEMRAELGLDYEDVEIPEFEVVSGRRREHPAWSSYQAYLAWRRAHDVRPVELEKRVYSLQLGYAGTTDLEAYVDDVLTIADFKTSAAVYDEYKLQIAAYRRAYQEMSGDFDSPIGGLVIRFPKEAGDTFEPVGVPWDEQIELQRDFMSAFRLFKRGLGR